jgi:hypothetical protein
MKQIKHSTTCNNCKTGEWCREGESAYNPIHLISTSPYHRKSRLYVRAEDGDLALALLLTYPYQTKHGTYKRPSLNLLSVAHYSLRPRKSVVLGFSDIVFDHSSYSKILCKL